jgi:abortive infection bacteriophage resistance protein
MVENGLAVEDRAFAESCLAEVNYYRLRGFWLKLEDGSGRFREGVTFGDVWGIYSLDRELRLWLWDAIGPIEVKLRTQFAYHLAHRAGPFGYLDESNFRDCQSHSKSVQSFGREYRRALGQKVPHVVHNAERYGRLPVWAAVELMSFGTLSQLYGNLDPDAGKAEGRPGVQASIARAFGLKPMYLKSWMHHLATVRNIAGHHDRFFNRTMTIQPKLLVRDARFQGNKEFPTLLVIKNIYERSWPERWPLVGGRLVGAVGAHANVDVRPMGFPDDWARVLGL